MDVAIIGAGWSGAVTARTLLDEGHRVEVFERTDTVGGHAAGARMNGVFYEPNGAHIFHTSNPRVANYVQRFGLRRPYQHCVVTEVFLREDDDDGVLLSWPPQIDELRGLPIWPEIARQLDELPPVPEGSDFESYVLSMMGATLYRLFIRDYTIKQWGREPTELSSSFAPKRVELRTDGNRRLFRDTWEFFPEGGYEEIIEAILAPVTVAMNTELTVRDLDALHAEFDTLVLTCPLDHFLDRPGLLEWRGIEMRSEFLHTAAPGATVTPAYVVNRPSPRVAYTRTVETKHASGQQVLGTVLSEEHPGSPARHYPVPTVDRRYEAINEELKREIREGAPIPVHFCGRLSNYTYINQDQAIEQAMACAGEILLGD
jgi:UDP-galactopyranose mutase